MQNKIKVLEGLIVKKATTNSETQIVFENGIILNIFNTWNFSGNFKDLKNIKIEKVIENNNEILFFLKINY